MDITKRNPRPFYNPAQSVDQADSLLEVVGPIPGSVGSDRALPPSKKAWKLSTSLGLNPN